MTAVPGSWNYLFLVLLWCGWSCYKGRCYLLLWDAVSLWARTPASFLFQPLSFRSCKGNAKSDSFTAFSQKPKRTKCYTKGSIFFGLSLFFLSASFYFQWNEMGGMFFVALSPLQGRGESAEVLKGVYRIQLCIKIRKAVTLSQHNLLCPHNIPIFIQRG